VGTDRCAALFGTCAYGASAAGVRRIRDYMTLACPALVKSPTFNQVRNGMLPCEGGVCYEAVTREVIPIPLEHYVTTLWDRPPPTAVDKQLGEWVRARIHEIVPHEELRAARLSHDLLTVGNPHKSICFFIGDGDNGKTTLMKVLKVAAPPGWVASTRANRAGGRKRANGLARRRSHRLH
jgi:hypothetical protein